MPARAWTIRWMPCLCLLALPLCVVTDAAAQFQITRYTIEGGGGTRSIGGSFALGGTIGQPDAGSLSGSPFALLGGFWSGGVVVTGVEEGEGSTPTTVFRLHAAAPNPFMHSTRVAFELPRATIARVALYDAAGRLVRVLADGPLAAGRHTQSWDRRDHSGRAVSPGIYFLRLDAGRDQGHQKLVVIH